MRAHFGLPSVECEDSEGKPPIQVRFEIPYFTTSGIQVRNRPLGTAQTLSCVKGYEYLVGHFYSFIIFSLPISTSLPYFPSPLLSQTHKLSLYSWFFQVRYLKIIEKSGYQALPWVRYITQNGDYQLRTHQRKALHQQAFVP